MSLAEVASFASISEARLFDFEEGRRLPSRKQMERIADTYGVPLYSLFGDAIPNLPPMPQDFRKSDPRPASLSARGVKYLILAERISQFSSQLAAELQYTPTKLLHNISIDSSSESRASVIRATFDDWYESRAERFNFVGSDVHRFAGALRLFFECQGGIVNINDAPEQDYYGFYVEPENSFPVIFVNRTVSSRKAQLFTLAHEYSHSLLRLSGISNPFQSHNKVERECNIFAAEFLAPMKQFQRLVDSFSPRLLEDVDALIEATSSRTLLSKHAAAIRLVEGGYLSNVKIRRWLRVFLSNKKQEKDEEREQQGATFGQIHAKRLGEIGYLPVLLAKRAVEAKFIDAFDVADGLGLPRTLQNAAFSLAQSRIEVATR